MGILDSNIKNNLFRQAGAVGASKASTAITSALNNSLFSKLGENNLFSARGFLGGITTRLLRETLFTRQGATGHFDPVWKLSQSKISAEQSADVVGSLLKSVSDDFAGYGRPKTKFNFTVQIEYRNFMKNNLPSKTAGNDNITLDTPSSTTTTTTNSTANSNDKLENVNITATKNSSPLEGAFDMGGETGIELALKNATRPQPSVVYQDVNFYNYRTKIATKVDYGTMTITFYDDIRNRAHDILDLYLKTISPISRIPKLANTASLGIFAVDGDDDFNPSSIGSLYDTDNEGLIRSITINHYLPIDYSKFGGFSGDVAAGVSYPYTVVQYIFLNPKIINMALDDLDMAQNDSTSVTLTFVYDSVYINKLGKTVDSATATSVPTSSNSFITGIQGAIDKATNTVTSTVTSTVNSTINSSTLLTKAKDFLN